MSRLPEPPIDDLHHGHVLGSRVYAHQPKIDVDDKMSPTARAGIFMGVSDLYKGVIVAYPETSPWQFEHSYHCTYDEAELPLLDVATMHAPMPELPEQCELPSPHVAERVRLTPPEEIPAPSAGVGRLAPHQVRPDETPAPRQERCDDEEETATSNANESVGVDHEGRADMQFSESVRSCGKGVLGN